MTERSALQDFYVLADGSTAGRPDYGSTTDYGQYIDDALRRQNGGPVTDTVQPGVDAPEYLDEVARAVDFVLVDSKPNFALGELEEPEEADVHLARFSIVSAGVVDDMTNSALIRSQAYLIEQSVGQGLLAGSEQGKTIFAEAVRRGLDFYPVIAEGVDRSVIAQSVVINYLRVLHRHADNLDPRVQDVDQPA